MKTFSSVLLLSFLLGISNTFGQTEPCKTTKTQPTLIIVPFAKTGEDFRTLLEQDPNKRTAITKVAEAFDAEGFPTSDFFGALNSAKEDQMFMSQNQEDAKSLLISMSAADIYVDVDLQPEVESTLGKRARIILKAYLTSNGSSLGNKECVSRAFETKDFGLLVSNAMEGCRKEFLATMQSKFDDIVANGLPVKVVFRLDQGSTWKFDKDVPADSEPLEDVIKSWVEKTSYKGQFSDPNSTSLGLNYNMIRLPLLDEKCKQTKPSDFGSQIVKFLKSKTIPSKKEIKNGTIYITIK